MLGSALALRLFLFFVPLLVFLVGVLGFLASSVEPDPAEQRDGAVTGKLAEQVSSAFTQPTTTRWIDVATGLFGMLSAGRALSKVLTASSAPWRRPVRPKASMRAVGMIVGILVGSGCAPRSPTDPARTRASPPPPAFVAVARSSTCLDVPLLPAAAATPDLAPCPGRDARGVVLTVMQSISQLYLPTGSGGHPSLYGPIGIAVVTLGWFFFLGRAVVLGIVVNAVVYERFGSITELVFSLPVLGARHPPTYDLVVRNGIVVDGTGLPAAEPTSRSRTAGSPPSASSAARRARDRRRGAVVVAPGIVDPHTHYDPQLTFEPYGTSSCFHGVTTVVAGNCGFSVAPLRPATPRGSSSSSPASRAWTPSALEGIPVDGFETFPEFLAHIKGRIGINAAFYVGHCAVRRYVMGDDSQTARPPTTRSPRWPRSWRGHGRRRRRLLHPLADPLRLRRPAGAEPAVVHGRAQGAGRRGRPGQRRLARLPARLGRRRHHAEDEELLIDLSLAARLPGDHPGPRRPLEGRRPDGRAGTTPSGSSTRPPTRGRPSTRWRCRSRSTARSTWRRHQALRGRPPVQPHVHRGATVAERIALPAATRRSATPCATRSSNPNRDPDAGPDAAAAPLGRAPRQPGRPAREREVRRPVARRHRRRARRAPHRRHARHRPRRRTSPPSSCGAPRHPSGSRARRSPRTTRT